MAQTKQKTHSGEGFLVGNLIAFVVMFALLLAGIYALSWWTLDNAIIPGVVCLVAVFLAFWVPMGILGRSDSHMELASRNRRR